MQWRQGPRGIPPAGSSSRRVADRRILFTAAMRTLIGVPGYAGISDINPDTSDNGNANASSGGRVNGLATRPVTTRSTTPPASTAGSSRRPTAGTTGRG